MSPPPSDGPTVRPSWVPTGHWPFAIQQSRFFYGWVIFGLSAAGMLMSLPGQTMGMAVYTDTFIDVLDLSRTELSLAYLGGTLGSSLFLTRAGRWFDVVGARVLMTFACTGLAIVLLYITALPWLMSWSLGTSDALRTGFAFSLILVGYFGVRFLGQGVMSAAGQNVLLVWFERRRGMVSGIRNVVTAFSFSVAPLALAFLIDRFGWQGSLWFLGAVLACGAVLMLVFLRDSPESCGLLPDGRLPVAASSGPAASEIGSTLQVARRSAVFWVYAFPLSVHAMFGTAMTFHVVAIFEEAGRGRSEAFAYFLPQAVASTVVSLVAGTLADRLPLQPFLIAMIVAFICGGFGLLHLEQEWGFWLLVAGFGLGSGFWQVIASLVFVRFFGRKHLGEVTGFNTALTVFASAIGPALFSVGYDVFGSFEAPTIGSMLLLGIALVAALIVTQREHETVNLR